MKLSTLKVLYVSLLTVTHLNHVSSGPILSKLCKYVLGQEPVPSAFSSSSEYEAFTKSLTYLFSFGSLSKCEQIAGDQRLRRLYSIEEETDDELREASEDSSSSDQNSGSDETEDTIFSDYDDDLRNGEHDFNVKQKEQRGESNAVNADVDVNGDDQTANFSSEMMEHSRFLFW